MNDALVVEMYSKGGKGKAKPHNMQVEGAEPYSIEEALARFIPAIMVEKMLSGKRKQDNVCAFLAKHVFNLPDNLPDTGSKDAIALFNTNILSKLVGVTNEECTAVLNAENGLLSHPGQTHRVA